MFEIFLAAAVFVIAAFLLYLLFSGKRKVAGKSPPPTLSRLPKIAYCPLCGSGMEGNRLYSKLIHYLDGRDMLEIRGCRLCYRDVDAKPRKCPSCHSPLDKNDFLLAELKEAGKVKRVAVKGCRRCYGR